jgi:hypothetical protein
MDKNGGTLRNQLPREVWKQDHVRSKFLEQDPVLGSGQILFGL